MLRDIGHLLNQAVNTGSKQGVTLSGKEISKMLAAHQQQQAKEEEGKIVSARKGNGFPGHTSGNLYTCAQQLNPVAHQRTHGEERAC